MRISLAISLILFACSAFSQSSDPIRVLATMADLIARKPATNETVQVRNYSESVLWSAPRTFKAYGTAAITNSHDGVHYVTNARPNSVYASADRNATDQDPRWYGAGPDDDVDDTLQVQKALDYAMTIGGNVVFPAGAFHFSPWSTNAYATNILVMGYNDQTGTNGQYSATHPDTKYLESPSYQSISMRGASSVARRAVFQFTLPNDTVTRGTTLIFTNMSGKVAIFSGNYQWGQKISDFSIIGESYGDDSVAIRHGVGSSMMEVSDVNIQWFGTAYAQGDDWTTVAQDIAADFNWIQRFKAVRVDTGIKVGGWNGYITHVLDPYISARVCIQNDYSRTGSSSHFSPKVLVTGGFLAPLTEYGGVLIRGTVVSVSATNVVVTNLVKYTKVRVESPYSMYLTNVAATVSDITAGMVSIAQGDTPVTGSPDEWGVLREVVTVDAGTSTVSMDGSFNSAVGAGDIIVFATPAIALDGDAFSLRGTHVEATNSEDLGFGPILFRFRGGLSPIEIDNIHVNLFGSESEWNRWVPKVYHERSFAAYPSPLTIRNSMFNVTFGKLLVDDSQPVRLENNVWKNWPILLDADGNLTDGVRILGDRSIMSTRGYYALATSELIPPPTIWWDDSRTFSAVGVPVPINRSISPLSSIGVSTEMVSVPGSLFEGFLSPRDNTITGVYGSQSALALSGTAAITNGTYFAAVTNLSNIFPGRIIEIAGAGAASGTLRARVLDTYLSADGNTKGVWLSAAAGTTVTAGALSGVAAEWQNMTVRREWGNAVPTTGYHLVGDLVQKTGYSVGSQMGWVCTVAGTPGTWEPFGWVGGRILIGAASDTNPALIITGGASGTDLLRLTRTSGTTQTIGFSVGASSMTLKDVTGGTTLLTLAVSNVTVPGSITLGGVARSTWPSGGSGAITFDSASISNIASSSTVTGVVASGTATISTVFPLITLITNVTDTTYTIPYGAVELFVAIHGPGAGGGSGRRGAAGTDRSGGGGGGSGGYVDNVFLVEELGGAGTVIEVTNAAPSVGASAITSDDTSGSNASHAGISAFGSYLRAGNASRGSGGGTTSGSGGAGGTGVFPGTSGGSGANTVGATGSSATSASRVGTGGGGGGGISSINSTSNGGAGGEGTRLYRGSGGLPGGAAGTSGGSGGDGNSPLPLRFGGTGGGGGSGRTGAAAGSGGHGAFPGGAGGGGGASENGHNSGAGGNGAHGYVLIIAR